jgi:hypothetical protein
MSRGYGRVARTIETIFGKNPDGVFTVEELARAVYRDAQSVDKKHRVAVLRAAKQVAAVLHWQFDLSLLDHYQRIFFNKRSEKSCALAKQLLTSR